MNRAKIAAQKLAAKFLENGNFAASPAFSTGALPALRAGPAAASVEVEEVVADPGFSGLTVQAVCRILARIVQMFV